MYLLLQINAVELNFVLPSIPHINPSLNSVLPQLYSSSPIGHMISVTFSFPCVVFLFFAGQWWVPDGVSG